MFFKIDGRGVIRLGDRTTHGGKVILVASSTEVDGLRIARIGDRVICPKCEGVFPIVEGEPAYLDEGFPVARDGHRTTCGAMLISSV